MKVELKDLKQIIDIEQKLSEKNSATKDHIDELHIEQFICGECKFPAITKQELNKHIENRHTGSILIGEKCDFKTITENEVNNQVNKKHLEEQFNCEGCDFQATTQLQLNKHTNLKHRNKGQNMEDVIHCKHCDQQFSEIWNLMNHRKLDHINTVAFCKKKASNECRFTSDSCWWRHEANNGTEQNTGRIECYICNKTFETKAAMMIHRKNRHSNVIKKCTKYQQNQCRFKDQFCWYILSILSITY